MENFMWNVVEGSKVRIVVWGTGKWGEAFLAESYLHDIPDENICFTNSTGCNDKNFSNFIKSEQLNKLADKDKTIVVIAIKDLSASSEIEKKAAQLGYVHVVRYVPARPNYDIFNGITIFMLHRVSDWEKGHLFSNENMKITPKKLDEFLSYLESRNVQFYSLEDVAKQKVPIQQGKGGIIFTMDDGYKDNLSEALPIFKRHNIPFAIFVTTDFPDKKAILWWYALEDLILAHDSLSLSNGKTYSCSTPEEKEKAFLEIRREILGLSQANLLQELNSLFEGYHVDWQSKNNDLCLSWEDIVSLKKEPLVTIGAHTAHHSNLKQLKTKDDVRKEVGNGIEVLKDRAGINASVFAYPFGSTNEVSSREIEELCQFSNIDCACLSYGGTVSTVPDGKMLKCLPRIMLTEDFIDRTVSNEVAKDVMKLFKERFAITGKASPISETFGFDRGMPIDRYYIEGFLSENASRVHGNILEIADAGYSKKFSHNKDDTFHVLSLDTPPMDATLLAGDLTKPETLPENLIDCFICTQTFNFIYDIGAAIRSSYRLLRKDGILLATVSGISQISRYDMDRWGHYWQFTSLSIRKLLEQAIPKKNIYIRTFGNALSATCFLQGLAVEDVADKKCWMKAIPTTS